MSDIAQDPVTVPQTATPTQPVTPEVPSQQKPDDMAARFAALAKKERIGRLTQHNLKTKEQALAERERQIAEREKIWEEEWKTKPLEALKRRNVTYQDITNAALNDGKFDPATEVKSVKEEIERLRQEAADRDKKQLEERQTQAQAAEQQAIEGFKANISNHIETNKEKFELTHLYEASDLVFQTVEEHFERTKQEGKPKILSVEEACTLVESYLESELERTAQSKKFQSKYGTKQKEDQSKSPPKSTTTLSNSLTPTSAAPSLLPTATENDRLKRALAALG